MDEVESAIVSAIASKTQKRPALSDDLARIGLDSLAMAEAAFEIEQKLKVKLDDGILDQQTVGDLVRHVRTLVARQSGQANQTNGT
jgi:acyl carrier protein